MREVNRKQRKKRWIDAKNLMRKYPECAYGGDFYCNHVYEPECPWVWVDFRFFHSKLKRYFAVAMVTAEFEAYEINSEKAWEMANFPPSTGPNTKELRDQYQTAATRCNKILRELCNTPSIITPRIEIKDYGSVAVGVKATVNTEYIDEHYIRDFIKFFRTLGEPTQPGWKWEGEAIEVIASRLLEKEACSS
jgi:hypothetical protein